MTGRQRGREREKMLAMLIVAAVGVVAAAGLWLLWSFAWARLAGGALLLCWCLAGARMNYMD